MSNTIHTEPDSDLPPSRGGAMPGWMTPLQPIHFGGGVIAWAKLERNNPGGSHKHRIAAVKVAAMKKSGKFGADGPTILILSSSGRAAGAFAAETAGIPDVRLIVVTDRLSPAKLIQELRPYEHVDVIVVDDPDATGSHLKARFRVIEDLKRKYPLAIVIDQYRDPILPLAYQDSLVQEVLVQTNGEMSIVFVPTGTGATLRAFDLDKQEMIRRYSIRPVDAEGSNLFRPADPGKKRNYSGYGNGKTTEFCKHCVAIDEPVHVPDVAVARMANWLLISQNLCVGPSSAAVAAAFSFTAWHHPDQIPNWGMPVLIFPDDGEAYADTLFNDDWLISHGLGKAVGGP